MKQTATAESEHKPSAGFRPVPTAGPRMRQIFLLDTLRNQNTIEAVLKNFIGLFDALKHQPMHYIVLVTFDVRFAVRFGTPAADFRSMVGDFEKTLKSAVPKGSTLELRTMGTDEMCALVKQAIPNGTSCEKADGTSNCEDCSDCTCSVDCANLQYPSIFAQDPFVALDYGPQFLTMLSSVVSPVAFSYSFVAGAIANGLPQNLRLVYPTRLHLVGGNILPQPDYAIVGEDTFLANQKNPVLEVGEEMPAAGHSRKKVTALLERQLGVEKIFWTGTAFTYPNWPYFQQGVQQPCFHVDFYLTPAGPQPDAKTGKMQELIFVGKLDTYNPPTDANSKKIIALMEKGLEEAASFFSQAQTPSGRPFKVVRVPLLLVGVTPQRTLTNKLLSFNQVLLQTVNGKTTVFMPDYTGPEGGDPQPEYAPWQEKAIRIYEAQGFEVVLVNGYYRQYSFQNGGSLHCMAKITERDPN